MALLSLPPAMANEFLVENFPESERVSLLCGGWNWTTYHFMCAVTWHYCDNDMFTTKVSMRVSVWLHN